MKRYSHHELNKQARGAWRGIQRRCAEGGAVTDYVYRDWNLVIDERGNVMQTIAYDVRRDGAEPLKRLEIIPLWRAGSNGSKVVRPKSPQT